MSGPTVCHAETLLRNAVKRGSMQEHAPSHALFRTLSCSFRPIWLELQMCSNPHESVARDKYDEDVSIECQGL